MATPIKYKKPRRINPVSVTLLALVLLAGYATYQYAPLYFMRHEAYRVLEETGSELSHRTAHYSKEKRELDGLRRKMQNKIRGLGINDPDIETWIEIEGKEVRLGVVYSAWVEWPFGVVKPTESTYELEHVLVVN
ncbi:MAG: hypothetical protein AAF799_40275 [Myxococcota bacterium]